MTYIIIGLIWVAILAGFILGILYRTYVHGDKR